MHRFLFIFLLLSSFVKADVVKPALVEISFFADNKLELEINLSLEAAMSGIGTKYKNTQDAPTADYYDELRVLEPEDLRSKFNEFAKNYLDSFELVINNKPVELELKNAEIDIVGYTKLPRKTVLTYQAQLDQWPKSLSWQYSKVYGDNAMRWRVYKEDEYTWGEWQWLRDGKKSELININHPPVQTFANRVKQFVAIGFDHVIPLGWDHILFIIGMALSSLVFRDLLILTATFTLAHTITLGLATADIVTISARIVEPLIAFSIAYVAIENLYGKLVLKRKSIIVFLFGLVHGLGFASMLKSFEMTSDNFLTTLISFNIGVELAQVLIVLLVFILLILLRQAKINYHRFAVVPVSVVIALMGIWWGVERIIF